MEKFKLKDVYRENLNQHFNIAILKCRLESLFSSLNSSKLDH